jgi:hypothetical protein
MRILGLSDPGEHHMSFSRLFIGIFLFASAAGCHRASISPAAPAVRSAVVLSIDALSEQRVRETLEPSSVPSLLNLLDSGACGNGATAAFPSSTAGGHAALWTGASGDVSGIAGNWQPRLPRDKHTLLEGVSGYLADGLRAEPLWLTAARSGVSVGGHHVTQAPGAPGYPSIRSGDPDRFAHRRREADSLLTRGDLLVMNGYNQMLARDALLTERDFPPGMPAPWRGVERLPTGVTPLEISWTVADDSVHALLYGASLYDRALVAGRRDLDGAVVVKAVEVDTSSVVGRPLARHFSEPLHLNVQGNPVSLRFRLFELAGDGTRYRLFHTAAPRADGSNPEQTEAYVREIGGWIGNASLGLLRSGAFGTPISRGGSGSAEAYYLETAELLTRQGMRGAEWMVSTVHPRLFLDYFPLADEIDHEFFGMVDRRYPGYDPVVAGRAQRVRERGWQLVDIRVAHARRLAEAMPRAAFFISGDHGMRPAWKVLRPNVALRDAGLLSVGADGAIDLERTVALSPNGYWINVNTVDWKGGVVPVADRDAVLADVERVLRAVRDEDGQPVVTEIWRSSEHPGLGIGGPAGGDLYFDLRFGYHISQDTRGPLISTTRPEGKHGYSPRAADMQTALCMLSPTVGARRIDAVRTIDLAPTVAEWLGIPAPRDARGRSLLRELTGEEGSR